MSNWSSRPLSSRPSGGVLPCDTQRELKDRLAEEGYALSVTKRNVGQWNEARDFFAEKNGKQIWLDFAGKGDRPDWGRMWSTFQTNQPMFD